MFFTDSSAIKFAPTRNMLFAIFMINESDYIKPRILRPRGIKFKEVEGG